MTEDEKLALKMQLGQFDEHDGESGWRKTFKLKHFKLILKICTIAVACGSEGKHRKCDSLKYGDMF